MKKIILDEKLVILAGGVSSRMKKAIDQAKDVDSRLLNEAQTKPKSMIGVGKNARPFMDYLLFNAQRAEYRDIVILVNNQDTAIKDYYGTKECDNKYFELSISYAYQVIPEGRTKPMGTADALLCALKARPDWRGKKFTVCNSDNLYSVEVLTLLKETEHSNAYIDYNRASLKFEESRISAFSVTQKDKEGYLLKIIEKPSAEQVESVKGGEGHIGISMNIWRFDYDMIFPILENVPISSERNEKELPKAVMMMIEKHPKSIFAIPMSEHVPDLTNPADIKTIVDYLQEEYKEFE